MPSKIKLIRTFKNQAFLLMLLLALCSITACKNHQTLQYSPPVKTSDWCELQPCLQLGEWVISQPSSSALVFVLTLLTFYVAIHFYKTRKNQKSRYWWFMSLLLAGMGALFAGISFQMFGYHIKCKGNSYCHLTSWWEIAYNMLTVWASAALLLAIAYSFLSKKKQRICIYYAAILSILYPAICIYGAVIPNQFLLSFECMILFTLPAYLFIITLHTFFYLTNKSEGIKKYIHAWALLALTSLGYVIYAANGYTQKLWEHHIWFSENDVLHALMIIWLWYILKYLSSFIRDVQLTDL